LIIRNIYLSIHKPSNINFEIFVNWLIQSITIKTYPADLSLSALICLAGAVQSFAVALVVERHPSGWAVGWDARLFAPLYTVRLYILVLTIINQLRQISTNLI